MRKSLFLLLFLAMFLVGCGRLDIEVEKDGSGTLTYQIKKNEYYSEEEIKSEIENSVKNINQEAGESIAKLKKVKDKGAYIEAVVESSQLFTGESGRVLATVSDINRYNPGLLEKAEAVGKQKENPNFLEDDKLQGLTVMYINDLDSMLETKIKVPGEVSYLSGGKLADGEKDLVEVTGSNAVIVYNPSSGFGFVQILLILLLAVGGYFGYMKFIKPKYFSSSSNYSNMSGNAGVSHE